MPWRPLPRIAFAVATYPFTTEAENELPLEIGDDLYIIEETPDGQWLRGWLLAPPSLMTGLTSTKGQTLETRVFSGIFPRSCVEIRDHLGEDVDVDDISSDDNASYVGEGEPRRGSDSGKSGVASIEKKRSFRKMKSSQPGIPSPVSPTSSTRNDHAGFKPTSHVSVSPRRDPNAPRPPAPIPMMKIGDELPTSASEPLIDEVASCLREWYSTNFHELLLSRKYLSLDELSRLIQSLDLARRQLLHDVLTKREALALREKTVWNLVKGNKICGGEVIVRDPAQRGRILTGDDSVVKLTKLQSVMSLLDEPPQPVVELTTLHHLLVDVRGFAGASSEPTTLVVYLVSKPIGGFPKALSESYVIEVSAGGTIGHIGRNTHMRTLFTDLASTDIGDASAPDTELFLVVKVRAQQQTIVTKPLSRSGTVVQTLSRSGTVGQAIPGFTKEKPPSSSGSKSSRRSLMWGSTRSAFSRGGTSKLDALSEQPEDRPRTMSESTRTAPESRDGGPLEITGSRGPRPSADGQLNSLAYADRMIGMGVLKLNDVMKQSEEAEHLITVWAPSQKFSSDGPNNEDEWDDLVNHLLSSKSGHYERSRTAERLQVQLKAFDHPDADALIKAIPTLLSGISKTNKMGFSGAPTKPRSDIYVTLDEALLSKQNLISRSGGSATSYPLHGANLAFTLEVHRQNGDRIENCISHGSNVELMTTFKSFVTQRGEPWNQTVRLSLSPSDVSVAHLMVTISDQPHPPFAIAYMPLWDQAAFIRDGRHSLLLYKYDETTQSATAGPYGKGGYLSLPWGPRGDSSEVTGPLATLALETYLCSTRFSQDRIILGLLRWKEQRKEDIPDLLKQLIFVPEIEIVKLLSDVLDALFGILVEHQHNDDYEDLVFTALVRVLGIVHDRRFNLGPLVEHYAENKFNYPFATPCLVRSFTRLLSKPTEPETARKLRATLKVVRHILKFITHARGQQRAKEECIGITSASPSFTRHLQSVFKALDAMMRSNAPVLVGSQTLAVQHFHTWLPELAGLLTTEEILHIAIDFMDSCSLVKGKLVLYKLVLIINYSKLELFSQHEQRSALCANTVRWIAPHWGHADKITQQWKDQVRLCCSVLASQVEDLGPEIPDYIPKIIDSYLAIRQADPQPQNRLSLLFPSVYPFPSKPISEPAQFDEALIELSAVLSSLSSSSHGMQLELTDDDLGVLIEKTLHVHLSILQGEAFPSTWLSVQIFHHKSTMKTLQYLAGMLQESFLPHPDQAESFQTDLWKVFFTTLLKLVGSNCLALETFPEQKRRAVWKIAGDVREHGSKLLRRTWEAIGWDTTPEERSKFALSRMGGYQVQYVPALVGPIVELCLSVHEGLRKMAVEILQTMIVSEWTLNGDLTVIQTEMIDHLDLYFKDKPVTESVFQKLFIGELLERFEPLSQVQDDPLYTTVQEVVSTVDEFLDLLVALHSGEDTSAATELINRLRLMEFLRDMQKEEIFVRYVHQLAALQVETRNYTEAGLALRLHADLYEWNPTKTVEALHEPDLPAQSHFERKERIYFDMIQHFEDGQAWANALAAYKELRHEYEENVFDFAKLARTERAIAAVYEKLAKSERLVPKYFKVVFRGLGFPPNTRDKEFLYEGLPNERTSAFTDRMQEQYQSAHILTTGDADSDAEGQYLVISAVTPHRNLGHHVFQRARVLQPIRDYVLSTNPQSFSTSSKRNTSGPVSEHYAEKIVYTAADPFPTILRRSEIVQVEELRLNAKETALERIVRKTQEMAAVERRLGDGDNSIAQILVDALRVSLNAEVESSIVRCRELITKVKPESDVDEKDSDDESSSNDSEEEREPELDEQETAIKMALVDHALMIKKCLASFSRSTSEALKSAYEELSPLFEPMYAPEMAVVNPPQRSREVVSSLPSPCWNKSPTIEGAPNHQRNTSNAGIVAEAAAAHPISLKQRGTRLSFLGGRRKESREGSNGELPVVNGDVDSQSQHSRADGNRRSFFRSASGEAPVSPNPFTQGFTMAEPTGIVSPSRKSSDLSGMTEQMSIKSSEHGAHNPFENVKKRLSLLKLGTGKKPGKMSPMAGGLVEE